MGQNVPLAFGNAVVGECWFGEPVRGGVAVLIQGDEHDGFDGEDDFARNHIAHLGGHGDGGAAEFHGFQTHFDHVAFHSGGTEVDFRHHFGDGAMVAELGDGINCRLFVNPPKQGPAEQGAVGVEVFRFHPFAGLEDEIAVVNESIFGFSSGQGSYFWLVVCSWASSAARPV